MATPQFLWFLSSSSPVKYNPIWISWLSNPKGQEKSGPYPLSEAPFILKKKTKKRNNKAELQKWQHI